MLQSEGLPVRGQRYGAGGCCRVSTLKPHAYRRAAVLRRVMTTLSFNVETERARGVSGRCTSSAVLSFNAETERPPGVPQSCDE